MQQKSKFASKLSALRTLITCYDLNAVMARGLATSLGPIFPVSRTTKFFTISLSGNDLAGSRCQEQ